MTEQPVAIERDPAPQVTFRRRLADEELAAAIKRGVKQCVVIGTAVGALAYQQVHPGLQVFQVGPGSQADLQAESLDRTLQKSSFRKSEAAFFSWLGASRYGTPEAALSTLSFIASMPRETSVVLDYIGELSLAATEQTALDALTSRLDLGDAPPQMLLQPEALRNVLRQLGFTQVDDLGPEQIENRFSRGQTVNSGIPADPAHLLTARV